MTHQQRAEETRERILLAALECFTRSGYDATGVAEICARAEVSKGAFYHHFPSKQAAFLALFEQWMQGLDGAMQALQATSATVPERLAAMSSLVGEVVQSSAGQLPMVLEFWRQAIKEPAIWQATIEPYGRFRAAFTGLMKEGIAEGSLRPVDADLAAHAVVSMGVGLVLQGVFEAGSGVDGHNAAEGAIRLLLEGLASAEGTNDDDSE